MKPSMRPMGLDVGSRIIEVQFAVIDADDADDTEVVAAVADKSIVVLHVLVIAENEVIVKFCDDEAGDLTGLLYLAARGGFSDDSPSGLFVATEGEALNINLGAAVAVGGYLTYFTI